MVRRGFAPLWLAPVSVLACGQASRPPILGDDIANPVADAGPLFVGNMTMPAPTSSSTPAPALLVMPTVAPNDDPTTCDQAASIRSYVGCDYWPTVVANGVWSIFDFAVVVANAGLVPATVTVTGPQNTNQTQTVAPNALAKFYLPWVSDLKGPDVDACGAAVPLTNSVMGRAEAFHLVSSVPVSVYQFNALEYAPVGGPPGKDWSTCPGTAQICPTAGSGMPIGCFSYTNDSSLLLPSTAMTGHYRITAYPGQDVLDGNQTLPAMNSYFAITATTDNTHVEVTLSAAGDILAGTLGSGIAATPGGGVVSLTMGAGDVAELAGGLGDAMDVSGSLVSADQPVQVIAGAPCDQIPDDAPACDHLEQSVFPAETLGQHYFVAAPTGPLGLRVSHVVRLYGNVDGTTLTYSPDAPPGCPTTLDAGEVVDCGLEDQGFLESTDFEVTGSHEFAVATFMLGGTIVDTMTGSNSDPLTGLGDPSESLIASVEQFRTKYVFLAPEDYTVNFVDIIAPSATTIALDGMFLNTALETEIADGYGVLRVPLTGVNPTGDGAHVLTASQPVGLQVLGYGKYTSYQYPAGLNLKTIAPAPQPR